jgi:hypothetical protein
MQRHSAFAVRASNAQSIAVRLGGILGLSFVPHESAYHGDYWRYTGENGSAISVSLNADPMYRAGDPEAEQFLEPSLPEFGVLVHASLPPEREAQFLLAVNSLGHQVVAIARDAGA